MLLNILMAIVTIISFLFMLYNLYFAILGLIGLKGAKPAPFAKPKTRFAVVAAARNEADVIGHLVDSLKELDYPPELYDIYVAPNNCTDDTEAVATAHGAHIFRHQGEVHSKGEVLTQFVNNVVLGEGYDAMVVFDADNLAQKDFLQLMNNSICGGAHAVQGFRDSKNPKQNSVSGSYSVTYWVLNIFFYNPRRALGLSAMINGSGFAVTNELLRKTGGWHTVTMTEDYEFTAQTILAGHRVHFVPEAVIYDEQPLTYEQSWNQRRRWGTGNFQGLELYAGKLLRYGLKHKSQTALDMFMTYIMPVVQVCGAITAVVGFVLALVWSEATFNSMWYAGIMALVGIVGALLGSAIVAMVTITIKKASKRSMWKAILAYGWFMFTWLMVTLSVLIKRQHTWDQIAHTNAVGLEQVDTADKPCDE